MEVSGVENIGQCGRLSQLRWLFGRTLIYLLTYFLRMGRCNGTQSSVSAVGPNNIGPGEKRAERQSPCPLGGLYKSLVHRKPEKRLNGR